MASHVGIQIPSHYQIEQNHRGKSLQVDACGSKFQIYLLYAITFVIQLFS
jgi:hypothetical protein